MMPIKEPAAHEYQEYDNNITSRVHTNMSEGSSGKNNIAKLSAPSDVFNYFNNLNSNNSGDLAYMYATNDQQTSDGDNLDLAAPTTDCQSLESEVKFLREWLLVHLELVQQQNDDILNKDNTILLLKQENAMVSCSFVKTR